MKRNEVIAIGGIAFFLIAPWFFVGLPWWGWFFASVVVLLGLWELASSIVLDCTLSQQLWKWSRARPSWKTWALLAVVSLGWLAVVLHLAAKVL